VGKPLPTPYPGQSMSEYLEQLVNFQKNYWSFSKPSKGGSKFIPLPPLTLIKKTKEMGSRKLSEHVEEELFDKEKRVKTPKVDSKKVIQSNEGVEPVKKKKPYYRKKFNKPKPVEVIDTSTVSGYVPEPVNKYLFIKGLLVGIILTLVITTIVFVYN
jgi:hypothetical protein